MAMAQTTINSGLNQRLDNLILPQPQFEEQYCRLCLSSGDVQFKQLFSPFNTTQNIVEVIGDFANVSILEGDEHSKLICCSCYIKLTESQKFKDLIENSDFKLRNQLAAYTDPLGGDAADYNEDSDHEKIDVEEADLKNVLINCETELLEDDNQNNSIQVNDGERRQLNQILISGGLTKGRPKKCDKKLDNVEKLMYNVRREPRKINIKKEKATLKAKKKRIKKDYQLRCPHCDKVFKRHEQRAVHLISHTGNYPFYCSFCNKGFAVRRAMIIHEERHIGEKNYQCEICGKSFVQPSNLLAHKKSHEDEKPFKCDQCTKEFKSKSYFKLHMASVHRSDTDKAEFVCKMCSKTYATEIHLGRHVKKYHNTERKLIPCEICGKSVPEYSEHRKSHTKPYKCGVCNRGFSNSSTLKEHTTIHTGEKPYECDICKKTFGFSGSLHTHKKIHDLTKRIQCEFCDKQFIYKHNWKLHLAKTHQHEETTTAV